MSIDAALSSGQKGIIAMPGMNHMGIFTVTLDDSSLVTGEALDLTGWFSTIDAVFVCGVSAIEIAGYQPQFIFTPGDDHTDENLLLIFGMTPALDGNAAAAAPLTPANAVDLAALGTIQIMVIGKAVDPRA